MIFFQTVPTDSVTQNEKRCQQIFRFYLILSFEPIKTRLPCEKVYSYLNIYHTFKSIELEPWVLHLVPVTTGFLKIDR